MDGEFTREPKGEIRSVVRDRQGSDHLAPFYRWAEAKTKHLPVEDRLSHLYAQFPKDLSGYHAYTHLVYRDHFRPEHDHILWRYRYRRPKPPQPIDYEAVLTEVIDSCGAHQLLNRHLSRHHRPTVWEIRRKVETKGPEEPRHFRGPGDIESFLEDLTAAYRASSVTVAPCGSYLVQSIRPCDWYASYRSRINGVIDRGPTYITETEYKTVPNPKHHPEWWKSFHQFCEVWLEHHGEVEKVRQAINRIQPEYIPRRSRRFP